MQLRTDTRDNTYLLWDADALAHATPAHFDPAWWRRQDRLRGRASGRGSVAFVAANGGEWVLRHYRRGGLIARLITDQYCWLGVERSRAFREFRLLADLVAQDLPAPTPVAAQVQRTGGVYRADLITRAVPGAETLHQRLTRARLAAGRWQTLGALIARFHAAGVYHHDLNAHNVLLDGDDQFVLIDFDKGRLRRPGAWCERNRARLRRSLDKLAQATPEYHFQESDWQALLGGYLQARRG